MRQQAKARFLGQPEPEPTMSVNQWPTPSDRQKIARKTNRVMRNWFVLATVCFLAAVLAFLTKGGCR